MDSSLFYQINSLLNLSLLTSIHLFFFFNRGPQGRLDAIMLFRLMHVFVLGQFTKFNNHNMTDLNNESKTPVKEVLQSKIVIFVHDFRQK